MKRSVITVLVFVAVLASFVASGCKSLGGDNYPTRQITYLVTWDPGGQSDVEARRQQPMLEKALGQKVTIEYKPGGGGAVGWAEMVRGKTDGYQITGINLPALTILPLLQDVGYTADQVQPINLFHVTPNILMAKKDSPFRNMKEFIDAAKSNPGKLKVGSTGTNSFGHVSTLRLKKLAGIEFEYVPFTGTAPMMTALLGGHIDVANTSSSDAVTFKEQAITLAVLSEKRSPVLPDLPTAKEQGTDLVVGSYRGIAVTAGTPDTVLRKLEKVFMDICNDKEYIETQKKGGYEPLAIGADESKKMMGEMTQLYRESFGEMGILKK